MLALLSGAAAVSVLCVTGILGFLAWFSLPLLHPGQLEAVLSWTWQPTAGRFGILPMAMGSLLLAGSAMLLAYPLGLGLALFVNGLAPRALARPLGALVRLMTGVPTVVYALAAVFLLVPLLRSGFAGTSGFSWLAALLVLALLVLPTIVLVLDGQLRLIAPELRLTAAALGLTRAQSLVRLALPRCGHGLKAAAALGLGRAMGDTLIALMLSGNAAQLPLAEGHWQAQPRNTHDAIVSGCLQAMAGAVERLHRQLPPEAPCVLSGGTADLLAPLLEMPVLRLDNLVLEGLARVAEQDAP